MFTGQSALKALEKLAIADPVQMWKMGYFTCTARELSSLWWSHCRPVLPGDGAGVCFPSQSEGMIIPCSPVGCFTLT